MPDQETDQQEKAEPKTEEPKTEKPKTEEPKNGRRNSTQPKHSSEHNVGRTLRRVIVILLCIAVVSLFGIHFVSSIRPDIEILTKPDSVVSQVISPVQSVFSSIVDGAVNYLYRLKLRNSIEEEYNKLRDENESLRNDAMLVRELQTMLDQYQSISDEVRVNEMLNPLSARVIGRESGNYFSVFTIDVGSNDGVEEYMAVTMDGALVGYTYNVQPSSCTVRTIIDSEASIAALLSTSRDQGTIRGTLDVDGQPMCRMYYLPENQLPRPGELVVTSGVGMSFPKGIPIGEVKESTRGMESNKSYVVVQPQADFEHIERVIVLRYQPEAEEVESRERSNDAVSITRLDTPQPVPTVRIGNEFFQLAPTAVPESTPSPTVIIDEYGNEITVTPAATEQSTAEYEYQVPGQEQQSQSYGFTVAPTASPTPTPAPIDFYTEED